MKRKLRSKGGFTLVETLICVALVAFFAVGSATVTTAVMSTRNQMVEAAHSQTLVSTALDTMADELRYAQEIKYKSDGTITSFTSATFGLGSHFLVPGPAENMPYIVVENAVREGTGYKRYELLPRSAYTGMIATDVSAKMDLDGDGNPTGKATISVTFEGAYGKYSQELVVTLLNADSVAPEATDAPTPP